MKNTNNLGSAFLFVSGGWTTNTWFVSLVNLVMFHNSSCSGLLNSIIGIRVVRRRA